MFLCVSLLLQVGFILIFDIFLIQILLIHTLPSLHSLVSKFSHTGRRFIRYRQTFTNSKHPRINTCLRCRDLKSAIFGFFRLLPLVRVCKQDDQPHFHTKFEPNRRDEIFVLVDINWKVRYKYVKNHYPNLLAKKF